LDDLPTGVRDFLPLHGAAFQGLCLQTLK